VVRQISKDFRGIEHVFLIRDSKIEREMNGVYFSTDDYLPVKVVGHQGNIQEKWQEFQVHDQENRQYSMNQDFR
jgi:hypothetical protein